MAKRIAAAFLLGSVLLVLAAFGVGHDKSRELEYALIGAGLCSLGASAALYLRHVRKKLARRAGQTALDTLYPLARAREYPEFKRGHDNEAVAVVDIQVVLNHTMTKYDRCVVLHNLVKYVDDTSVPGNLVECGVWKGGAAGIMALAHLRYGKEPRQLWLFDAWDDWPDPTSKDGSQFDDLQRGTLAKADNSGAFEACRDLIENTIGLAQDRVSYERGLFENTVPGAAERVGPIALLRLDGDWYESTKACLEEFFPKLVPGGVLVIDDYGWCDGCKRAVDEFLEAREIRSLLHYVDYSCRYLIKNEGGGRFLDSPARQGARR